MTEKNFDVIVVGGGPSGAAAAVCAAREGMKVLLIEQTYCLGGMWTSGFVNPIFDFENKKGFMKELVDELKSKGQWGGFWEASFTYEYMKEMLERKCLEAGVTLLYDTHYEGAVMEGNRIVGVRFKNIEGDSECYAKVIIDASGDALVAADAGAVCRVGDKDGKCQSVTLMYIVSGIPEKYKDGKMIYDELCVAYKNANEGKEPPFEVPYLIPAPGSGFGVVQLTHMNAKPLSAADRTAAVIEGRRQMLETFEMLKHHNPDFEGLHLVQSAPLLGIRESRRIEGEYCVNTEDIMNGSHFPDAVARVTFNVDIHGNDQEQVCCDVTEYEVPYRSLIPKGIEGLLVAGKTISGTHTAMASYRVTGNCCAMGENAGRAAAYAVKNGVGVREVPNDTFIV
ncbi:MAG: FAD-dependent oxidoreductase [Clostridia bacterium]|nr:FAD-dependent oxidoreductase [Clostridia bacterium]